MKGWLDSPIESFRQTYEEGVAKWQAALAALDAAYAEFVSNQAYAQQDPDLAARWSDLDGKVSFLQATIQNVASAMDSVQSFFSGIGASVGLSGRDTMRGMGFLPAVPWALVGLVASGAAAVWVIVNQLRAFNVDVTNKKIALQNIQNSQNGQPLIPYVNPEPSGDGSGIFSGVSNTVKWGAIGLGLYMLFNSMDKKAR